MDLREEINHRRGGEDCYTTIECNHEEGSSAAVAVDGGRRSWRKTSAEDKGDGRKRQEEGSMDPYAQFHPLFILSSKRQPIERGALCPHRVLRIPKR
jgi:hypothetical protein